MYHDDVVVFSFFSSLSSCMSSFLNNPHSAYQDVVDPILLDFPESEGGGGGAVLGRLVWIAAIERRFKSQLTLEFELALKLRLELSGELVDFSLTAKMPESTSNESVT